MAPITRRQTRSKSKGEQLQTAPSLAVVVASQSHLQPLSTLPHGAPSLPIEILGEILSLLCFNTTQHQAQRIRLTFGAVCRSWYQATPRFFVCKGADRAFGLAQLLKSSSAGSGVKKLFLDGTGDWDDGRPKKVAALLTQCRKVESLEIHFGLRFGKKKEDLLGVQLKAAWRKFTELKELKMVLGGQPCNRVSELLGLLSTFTKLESFELDRTLAVDMTSSPDPPIILPLPFALHSLVFDVAPLSSTTLFLLETLITASKGTLKSLTLRTSVTQQVKPDPVIFHLVLPVAHRLDEFKLRLDFVIDYQIKYEEGGSKHAFCQAFEYLLSSLTNVSVLILDSKDHPRALYSTLLKLSKLRYFAVRHWSHPEGETLDDFIRVFSSLPDLRRVDTKFYRSPESKDRFRLEEAARSAGVIYANSELYV